MADPNVIISAMPDKKLQALGSMTPQELLEFTNRPPNSSTTDPMGRRKKLSEVTAADYAAAGATLPLYTIQAAIGKRAYHRKQKEECTILAAADKPGIVKVKWPNGDKTKVKLENLTLL